VRGGGERKGGKERINASKDVEKLELLGIATENVKWCTYCGKNIKFFKN
jgi:hypothetical protein